MKKRKLLIGGLMALAIFTTTSCNNENSKISSSTPKPQTVSTSAISPITSTISSPSNLEPKEKYTEKMIKVYYSDSNEDHKIRYYDNTPSIPYLGIKDYYKLLLKKTDSKEISDLTVITTDDINYTVTCPRDASITLNVKDNYLVSNHFSKFINTNRYIKTGESTSYDGSPWLKIDSVTSNEISHAKYIDFDDYYIDIYGDDTDVYLPISFLGDMFTGMNLLHSSFNGKNLFIVNGENGESYGNLENYNDDIFSETLTQEYIDFTYNSFCLFYDHFAGKPGRTALENFYDLSYGLDKALEQRPLGRIIKEYIKSPDIAKFTFGYEVLGSLVNDGGHTRLAPGNNIGSSITSNGRVAWLSDEVIARVNALANEIKPFEYDELIYTKEVNDFERSPLYPRYYRKDELNTGSLSLRGSKTYYEKGDTAIICLDDYMGDYETKDDWIKYYNGETNEIPYTNTKGGSVAAVFKGLERAHANPNIKYVAIDIAANAGGSSDELLYVVSLLTADREKRNSLVIRNQLDNNVVTTKFKIDRNLDREFNEEDDTYDAVGDLKVFVITSVNSFSCGGISPIYLHDLGLPVAGDNCGGGSCAIIIYTNALGFQGRFSSAFNILAPNSHGNIDNERFYVCDYFIEHPNRVHPDIPKNLNGSDKIIGDYSNYYNLDFLSNLAKTVIFK